MSANAKVLLAKKYLRMRDGALEQPEELFARVARVIADADLRYNRCIADIDKTASEFCNMMAELRFMPNSPTLLNAGRRSGQLSACFVLPIEDSIEGIFTTLKYAAEIHKSGGGTGFSFSRLRPAHSPVQNSITGAQGPIPYLHLYNNAMGTVEQGGARRGGNMAVLRVDHPDIMEFIICKQSEGELSNFNISVAVTDSFMQSLEGNSAFYLVNPRTGETTEADPQQIWRALVNSAHANGEPGLLFIDTVNNGSPTKDTLIEAINPCGEQPLLPYESCNLGSINLARFIRDRGVDYDSLGDTVRTAVHFLDNVIDVNKYPIERLREMAELNRKIGLGVMGFADTLIALNIQYDSQQSFSLAERVMKYITDTARGASHELALTRGSFPNINNSIYANNRPMRNATVTTIAPTGSISIIAGCSSGIEPLFALSYLNRGNASEYVVVCPLFENIARTEGFYSPELMSAVAANGGSAQGVDGVPAQVGELFVIARDLSPAAHVQMQAAFQKHTDNAVSKTVNLPNDATAEAISNIFKLAWESGCKGITVYRDGSRQSQPLETNGLAGNCSTGKCDII